jgi:hypothetical protein
MLFGGCTAMWVYQWIILRSMRSKLTILVPSQNQFIQYTVVKMEVSINGGTPKWLIYNGKPIKIDDSGVPLF